MRKRALFKVLLQTIVRQLSAQMMVNANNEKRSVVQAVHANTSQATSQATASDTLQRQVLQILEKRQPSVLQSECLQRDLKVRILCVALCFRNESDRIERVVSCVCVCVARNWSFCPFDIIAAPHSVELWTKNWRT